MLSNTPKSSGMHPNAPGNIQKDQKRSDALQNHLKLSIPLQTLSHTPKLFCFMIETEFYHLNKRNKKT